MVIYKVTFYFPLPPTLFPLFSYRLLQNNWLDSHQILIFVEKLQCSCHLHHRQKKQKNPKVTIDDKVSLYNPSDPDASPAALNNTYHLIPDSTVSNSPNSLINCNKYFKLAQDTQKKLNYIYIYTPNKDDLNAAGNDADDALNANDNDDFSIYSKKYQYLLRKRIQYLKMPATPQNTLKQ